MDCEMDLSLTLKLNITPTADSIAHSATWRGVLTTVAPALCACLSPVSRRTLWCSPTMMMRPLGSLEQVRDAFHRQPPP
jgi:hypothetical protein